MEPAIGCCDWSFRLGFFFSRTTATGRKRFAGWRCPQSCMSPRIGLRTPISALHARWTQTAALTTGRSWAKRIRTNSGQHWTLARVDSNYHPGPPETAFEEAWPNEVGMAPPNFRFARLAGTEECGADRPVGHTSGGRRQLRITFMLPLHEMRDLPASTCGEVCLGFVAWTFAPVR